MDKASDGSEDLEVKIYADTYFGARHGVETLFQLMEYDDIRESFVILDTVEIVDAPEFPHRGITLDTSRNFIEVPVIKRIIDGMSHSKVRAYLHKTLKCLNNNLCIFS